MRELPCYPAFEFGYTGFADDYTFRGRDFEVYGKAASKPDGYVGYCPTRYDELPVGPEEVREIEA